MEKVILLLCDHPTQDSTAEITLTHDHVQSVPGERATSFAPNVPWKHREYTNLYKLITAGSPHIRIFATE